MAYDVAVSCLVDDVEDIWKSIVPWLATVTKLAGIPAERIYVHHVVELPSWLSELCAHLGVNTRPTVRFESWNPCCNKIRQFSTGFGSARSVVFTDVDIAFTGPLPLGELDGIVAGKPVDYPNPPLDVLLEIIDEAGIEALGTSGNAYVTEQGGTISFETLLGNFNGGFYVIPRYELRGLSEGWARWAHWLGARRHLMREWDRYLDQIALCLTLNEQRLATRTLDDRWNYPAHVPTLPLREKPFALHHHARLDDALQLLPVSDTFAQAAVEDVNRAIADFRRLVHPHR